MRQEIHKLIVLIIGMGVVSLAILLALLLIAGVFHFFWTRKARQLRDLEQQIKELLYK